MVWLIGDAVLGELEECVLNANGLTVSCGRFRTTMSWKLVIGTPRPLQAVELTHLYPTTNVLVRQR
jgi:hypothetical protein